MRTLIGFVLGCSLVFTLAGLCAVSAASEAGQQTWNYASDISSAAALLICALVVGVIGLTAFCFSVVMDD